MHEVWSAQLMKDGWTYGPVRNDAAKQLLGLVPYDELPESEKEYDHNTAGETLKTILLLRYSINKPQS